MLPSTWPPGRENECSGEVLENQKLKATTKKLKKTVTDEWKRQESGITVGHLPETLGNTK